MTPAEAMGQRIFEARRDFRYIPDAERDATWWEQVQADYFNAPKETEARGGGDCDDWAVFGIMRGYELLADLPADDRGRWSLVLGQVKQASQWSGHAWAEILTRDAIRLWADPTWGWTCRVPRDLGWPATRRGYRLFPYDGTLFAGPIELGGAA